MLSDGVPSQPSAGLTDAAADAAGLIDADAADVPDFTEVPEPSVAVDSGSTVTVSQDFDAVPIGSVAEDGGPIVVSNFDYAGATFTVDSGQDAKGSFANNEFEPAPDFNGTVNFTLTPTGGGASLPAILTVTSLNDDPVIKSADTILTVAEDGAVSGSIFVTDTADGDNLTYTYSDPSHGKISHTEVDGTYTYTPSANYTGSDGFTVIVNENGIASPVTQAVSVIVTSVPDQPMGDAIKTLAVTENTVINSTVGASDYDNDVLTYTVTVGPTKGSLGVSTNGAYAYTPNADTTGSDSFVINVSDGDTDTADLVHTVFVTIDRQNSDPDGYIFLTGHEFVGQELNLDLSNLADDDGIAEVISYHWMRNGELLSLDGANSGREASVDPSKTNFPILEEDIGSTISVQVTYKDNYGTEETFVSKQSAVVRPSDYLSDDPSTIGSIAIDGSTVGPLEGQGDRDWFAVELQRGGQYTFTQSGGDEAGMLADTRIYGIYTEDGKLIPGTQNDDWAYQSDNEYDSRVDFLAPTAGTYFLSAGAHDDEGIGDYTVSLSEGKEDFDPDANKGEHLNYHYDAIYDALSIGNWEQTAQGGQAYFGSFDAEDRKDSDALIAELVDQLVINGIDENFNENGIDFSEWWISGDTYKLQLKGDITETEEEGLSGTIEIATIYGPDIQDWDVYSDTIIYAAASGLSTDVSNLTDIFDKIIIENEARGYADVNELIAYDNPSYDITGTPNSPTEIIFNLNPDANQDPHGAGISSFYFRLKYDPTVITIDFNQITFYDGIVGEAYSSDIESGQITVGGIPSSTEVLLVDPNIHDLSMVQIPATIFDTTKSIELIINSSEFDDLKVGSVREVFDFIARDVIGTVVTRDGDLMPGAKITAQFSAENETINSKTVVSSEVGTFKTQLDFGANMTVKVEMPFVNFDETRSITPQDAYEALLLSVGKETTQGSFTKFDMMAADFDQDRQVTADDALAILKYSVGNRQDVPTAKWMFVEGVNDGNIQMDISDTSVLAADFTFEQGYLNTFMTDDVNLELTGVLLGDVNNSYSDVEIM